MYKLRTLFFNFGKISFTVYISQISFLSSVVEMVAILGDLLAFASHKCAFHRKKSRRYDVCMRRIWNVNYFDSRDSRLPPFRLSRFTYRGACRWQRPCLETRKIETRVTTTKGDCLEAKYFCWPDARICRVLLSYEQKFVIPSHDYISLQQKLN